MSRAKRSWSGSLEVSFVYAVFKVELAHVLGVDVDDHDVDDQRALRRHVKTERESEKAVLVELSGIPRFHECRDKPHREEYRRDYQISAPVLLMLRGQLHAHSSCRGRRAVSKPQGKFFYICHCHAIGKFLQNPERGPRIGQRGVWPVGQPRTRSSEQRHSAAGEYQCASSS